VCPAIDAELQQFGFFRSRLVKERVFLDIFDAVGPLGDLVALLAISEPPLDDGYLKHWAKLLDDSIGGTDVSERLLEARRKASSRRD
jgi:hypothetical protein